MPSLMKILVAGLLVVLLLAIGSEVVALRHLSLPPAAGGNPVVVRKLPLTFPAPKTVRAIPTRPPVLQHSAKAHWYSHKKPSAS